MASPRLICKSAYIKDAAHFFELLEYSGDKIAAQSIVFKDGSEVQVNADDIITLSPSEQSAVQGIRITFKDGGRDRVISYDTYHRKTLERKEVIRYSDIATVRDDSLTFGVGTGPHAIQDLDFFRYLSYIDGRPGVEKEDGHGLFGLDGNVDIEDAKAMAAAHEQSCKWSHIISMDGQDAADTGFDNRAAWRDLIVSKAPEIAKTYGISLENLVVNCAYHSNTDNPHVHLMFYSKDSTEGFVKGGTKEMNKASEHLKSTLVNTIFKNETAELGREKTMQRDAMKQQLHTRMTSLVQYSVSSFVEPLEKLAYKLEAVGGKKEYDYLPPEVKAEVDSLVETVITQNTELEAIYKSYCKVQERMIGRYVVSPDALQDKLEQFKTHFFHPRKQDLKMYHNMVIRAACELSENREAWQQKLQLRQRTTEGEIEDDNTDSTDLSSLSFYDEQTYMPEQRTAEGEIGDDNTDNTDLSSTDFYDEPYTAPELLVDEYELEADIGIPSRQTEASPLSRLPKEQWEEMNAFLKEESKAISPKKVSKLFRQSMRGIFNPKLQNTYLQQQVLELLRGELEDKKLIGTAKKDIFFIVKTTDRDFREGMDTLVNETNQLLREKFGASAADSYMTSLNRSLEAGTSYYLGCIDKYASSLDDEQYFQLLDAYKEFNDPLNKEIHKAVKVTLKDSNPDFVSKLEKLKALSPYLKDDGCNKAARDLVKQIFDDMSDKESLNNAKADWLCAYHKVLDDNMSEQVIEKYNKRLDNTFNSVLRLMRPHYTVVRFAKNLNKMQFQEIATDKAVCKLLKKSIRMHLNECLTDTNSFSAAFVRQKLEHMRDNPSPQDSGELVTFLYGMSEQFRAEIDNHLSQVYERLKEKMSAEVAGAFVANYKAELFKGGEYNSIHNSIAWYAKCFDENLFNVILREHKDCLKEINTAVVKGLWNNIEDAELLPLMQALKAIPIEDAAVKQAAIRNIRQIIYQKAHESSGEKIFDEAVERCVQSFRAHFEQHTDPNTVLSFEERLRTYLWQADLSCSYSYIISHFTDELDTHRYENFLKHQLKSEEVRTYRTNMYRALGQLYRSGGEAKEQLQAIFDTLPTDETGNVSISPKLMDDILRLLSSPENDMLGMKDKLMESLYSRLEESGVNLSLDAKEQKKIFESFFYGDEHNTFFFREMLQQVAVEGMPTPSTSIFLLRRLLLDIGRALCGQSNNAQRYAGDSNSEHSFRVKKQFKNVRFPREQGEIYYEN